MASWDVFHAETLELERGLSSASVRQGLVKGSIREDDLVRPAGTSTPWTRLGDVAELTAPGAATGTHVESSPPTAKGGSRRQEPSDFELVAEEGLTPPPAPTLRSPDWLELRSESDDVAFPVLRDLPAAFDPGTPAAKKPPEPDDTNAEVLWAEEADDDEDSDDAIELEEATPEQAAAAAALAASTRTPTREASSQGSRLALPVVHARDYDDVPVVDEDDETFTFSRGGPQTVEELDLAPMVDVAFQLVLFFMVTATTVMFKTLEIPKPSNENAPASATQGRSRSLDDLSKDYVLVEIDSEGNLKIDREPAPADLNELVERLRSTREKTGRTSMLLSAEYLTRHRAAVLAYDAAHEIGMGIVIARPSSPEGAAPTLGSPSAASPPASKASASAGGSTPPL